MADSSKSPPKRTGRHMPADKHNQRAQEVMQHEVTSSFNVLVVTSAVTFVPQNYDELILGLADEPSVAGLLVIDNRTWKTPLEAIAMILSLSAPRLGWALMKNQFGSSLKKRKTAYQSAGKKFWMVTDIHSKEALKLLKSQPIDVILNCRTRSIFKKQILEIPNWACLNIHHGLLPIQRGLMCDFWAHLEKTKFGFSIHQMTEKIDDGPILEVVENPSSGKNYLESLHHGSILEKEAVKKLFRNIETRIANFHTNFQKSADPTPSHSINAKDILPLKDRSYHPFQESLGNQITYRKNPRLRDGYRMQRKGVKI